MTYNSHTIQIIMSRRKKKKRMFQVIRGEKFKRLFTTVARPNRQTKFISKFIMI